MRVAWLAGKVTGKARAQRAARRSPPAQAQVVVGTHALMQEGVAFHDLALAIVDEQHRFGVHQRLALRDKGAATAQLRAAPAGDDRDADPAHAGDGGLRRPRRLGDRRAAARAHAGADRGAERASAAPK